MSDKHAIEVFQDLSILGPETRRAELREALIAAATSPLGAWDRRRQGSWSHGPRRGYPRLSTAERQEPACGPAYALVS